MAGDTLHDAKDGIILCVPPASFLKPSSTTSYVPFCDNNGKWQYFLWGWLWLAESSLSASEETSSSWRFLRLSSLRIRECRPSVDNWSTRFSKVIIRLSYALSRIRNNAIFYWSSETGMPRVPSFPTILCIFLLCSWALSDSLSRVDWLPASRWRYGGGAVEWLCNCVLVLIRRRSWEPLRLRRSLMIPPAVPSTPRNDWIFYSASHPGPTVEIRR